MQQVEQACSTFQTAVDAEARKAVRADLRIMAEKAKCARQVADIKDGTAKRIEELEAKRDGHRRKATVFLLARKPEILKQHCKTETVGSVYAGFRLCSNVEILDEAAVIAWADETGCEDVVVREPAPPPPPPKVSKAALRKHLKAGRKIPGARILSDYEPFVEAISELKEKARAGQPIGRIE